jgi:hypothetical protein
MDKYHKNLQVGESIKQSIDQKLISFYQDQVMKILFVAMVYLLNDRWGE